MIRISLALKPINPLYSDSFPIHIDTVSPFYYLRSELEFSELWCISVPEDLF